MLRWLFKEFKVLNTLWQSVHTALLRGCRCCCSLCLFRVSLVLSSLPQTSQRWVAIKGRGRLSLRADHREHITPIRPPLYFSQACLTLLCYFIFYLLYFLTLITLIFFFVFNFILLCEPPEALIVRLRFPSGNKLLKKTLN